MAIVDVDGIMSVTEIAENWKKGNCHLVVGYLRSLPHNTCHIVSFATLVIFRDQGECEANRLVNMLMDKFIETRD